MLSIEDGRRRALRRDFSMAPTEVLVWDPCPYSFPVMLSVACMALSPRSEEAFLDFFMSSPTGAILQIHVYVHYKCVYIYTYLCSFGMLP